MNNCLCRQPVWLCRSPLHHLYSKKERRKTNLSKTVWDHTGRHAGSDRYEASVAAQGLLWRPTQPVRHTGNLQENYFITLAATTRDILMWEDLWRRETSSGFCASYLLNVHLMVLKSDVFLGWTVFRQRSSFLFFFSAHRYSWKFSAPDLKCLNAACPHSALQPLHFIWIPAVS